MKIRYIFEGGAMVESIPDKTTSELFAEAVQNMLAEFGKIVDIKFVS